VAEQEYHREKARRHNLRLHSSGVVRGLTVSLQGGATRQATVNVKPGVGIDPAGNELELEAGASVAVPARLGAFVVVIRYVEWTAAHTALALARFVRSKAGWRRDTSFRPRRSR